MRSGEAARAAITPLARPRVLTQDAGFTLVGAMIAVLVVNIMLGVAVTSWVTIDRRAREAELIWRGQQIARAIACYGQADAGEPLQRLEQLVQASCLRRLYVDPMTRGGEWRILRQQDVADGTVAALLGQPVPAVAGGSPTTSGAAGGLGLSEAFGREGLGNGGAAAGIGLGVRRSAASTQSGQAIVGVVSKSTETGLRQYAGRRPYGEWVFLAAGLPAGS